MPLTGSPPQPPVGGVSRQLSSGQWLLTSGVQEAPESHDNEEAMVEPAMGVTQAVMIPINELWHFLIHFGADDFIHHQVAQ